MRLPKMGQYWAAQIVERLKRPQEGVNNPLVLRHAAALD